MSPQICCSDDGQTEGDEVGEGRMANECDVGVDGATPVKFEVDLATVATSRGMIQLWRLSSFRFWLKSSSTVYQGTKSLE